MDLTTLRTGKSVQNTSYVGDLTTEFSHDIHAFDYESQDFPNTIWFNKGTHDILINVAMFLPVCILGLAGDVYT
ncbi:hypothetical protein D910_10707 [Dendroctonus ponderosae]|uniref:Uncharacterized protein n=1 Tax=Dendroctonus ponderosae TaxID=77166 RepID=U4UTG3_DENPD|nr:hypothetical protein D910_10707 [Dendroctonus ponderosae]